MSGVHRALSKVVHAIPHPNGDRKGSQSGEMSPTSGSMSPTNSAGQSHAHRKSLAQVFHLEKESHSGNVTSDYDSSDYDSDNMSKNAIKREARKKAKADSRSRLSLDSRDESEEGVRKRLEAAKEKETDEMRARYGDLPLMQSTARGTENRINIDTISEESVGQEVTFRCRLHHVRMMGPKLAFLLLRQQISTIQGVLHEEPGVISQVMIHWAEHLRTGSILRVKGKISKPQIPVKSASIHAVEIQVTDIHIITRRAQPVPFSVQEAELTIHDDEHKVDGRQSQISDRTRLANRILDLRTAASQSIFRIQAGIGNLFRYALDERHFVEIHSPKLQVSSLLIIVY
jgi:ergosteryl-3beta-O-L-aspartate synthase